MSFMIAISRSTCAKNNRIRGRNGRIKFAKVTLVRTESLSFSLLMILIATFFPVTQWMPSLTRPVMKCAMTDCSTNCPTSDLSFWHEVGLLRFNCYITFPAIDSPTPHQNCLQRTIKFFMVIIYICWINKLRLPHR